MFSRGLYCLMKFCSTSSASASVWTTSASMWSIIPSRSRPARGAGVAEGGGARLGARVAEVGGDPLADRDRLADVDHLPARVAEHVHAGRVGELAAVLGG